MHIRMVEMSLSFHIVTIFFATISGSYTLALKPRVQMSVLIYSSHKNISFRVAKWVCGRLDYKNDFVHS